MEILHLNLKKKWFDMILSGVKIEEYREIKPHWHRIFSANIKIKNKYYHPTDIIICFSNGYSKNRRQMIIQCNGLRVSEGFKSWGAEINKQYYVLLLGKIITTKNINEN